MTEPLKRDEPLYEVDHQPSARVFEQPSKWGTLVRTIENLYPADAPCDSTAAKGRELLGQALVNVRLHLEWRGAPTRMLEEYARLCVEENQRPIGRPGVT